MKYSLLLCLVLFAGTTCAFSDTIYVSPASLNVSVGQTVAVDIDVDNIADLYGYQFTLTFNPAVLAADSITEGALFADTNNNSFFLPGTIDNSTGNTGTTADTLLSPPGVNGPGVLAVVDFTALAAGASPFDLSNVMLLDPSLTEISVTPVSGTADVVTAEPATLSLLLTALVLMLFGKLRRSKRAAIVASRSKRQQKGGVAVFNF